MPKDDAIIQEVRAVRRKIAEECGNDIQKIIEHSEATMQRYGFKTVAV